MVKEKRKKIKVEKIKTEEQEQIQSFLKILAFILIFIIVVYAFTKIFVKKEINNKPDEVTKGEINYDKLIAGNIFSPKYKEYYVFAYNGNNNDAIYYGAIVDIYKNKKDSLKVYWIDLDNQLNKKYIVEKNVEINKNPKNILELKFGEFALLKIENKKVVKYINNVNDAIKELN